MHEPLGVQQMALFTQVFGHFLVGIPNRHPNQPLGNAVVVGAITKHRTVRVEALAQTRLVVLGTMARGGVHQTGAVFQSDVVRGHHASLAIAERVLVRQPRQGRTITLGQNLTGNPSFFGDFGRQIRGQNRKVAVHLAQGVAEALVDRDGQVGGQGPRGRGPNGERRLLFQFALEGCSNGVRIARHEVDIHRQIFPVLVFKFGFGQCSLVGNGPVHRLTPAGHQALIHHIGKAFQNHFLIRRVHGEIRRVVFGVGQKPGHLSGLDLHKFLGERLALFSNQQTTLVLPHRGQCFTAARFHQVGHHLVFDGQPMAIPARHEGHLVPLHQTRTHHKILQHLVKEVPQVQVPVGKRRAIVEHKRLRRRTGFTQLFSKVDLGPPRYRVRLVGRKASPHGEVCLGQVERVFPLSLFGGGCVAHALILRVFARLDGLVQIGLELTNFVRDKAECMMQGKPLRVGGILVQIGPETVQFRQHFFDFDG